MSAAERPPFRLHDAGSTAVGHRFRIEIPRESSLFEGHFPGHPILPGIAHLAFAESALRQLGGTGIFALRGVRLRRPVRPGEALELLLSDPDEQGWSRFELLRQGETVSAGAMAAARGNGDAYAFPHAGVPPAVRTLQEIPAIEALLPHAPPARWLRGVVAIDAETICGAAEIPITHPLLRDGRMPAFAGIEAAAQAAAVLEALNRPAGEPASRIGYLVGIRTAEFSFPYLPAGQALRVIARRQGGAFPLSLFDIGLGEPGEEALTGTISAYLADR